MEHDINKRSAVDLNFSLISQKMLCDESQNTGMKFLLFFFFFFLRTRTATMFTLKLRINGCGKSINQNKNNDKRNTEI